jgi:hypothetical protein
LTAVVAPGNGGKYYELQFGSMLCGCPVNDTDGSPIPVPEIGDKVAIYGSFGYPIRGLFIRKTDGWHCVYYRTPEEQEKHHQKEVAASELKEREAYEQKRPGIEARIAALPPEFRARFDRFNAGSSSFCWKFSEYELFGCEQAVAFAAICPTIEALEAFRELDSSQQRAMLPEGPQRDAFSGHSGNTFGFAVRMAAIYLKAPENVERMHGALVPLVGCEAYGCTHEASK